jgi:hypothetical protein
MSESGRDPADEEILGRLPRTRPGRRSPRRDEAAQQRAKAAERAKADSAQASAGAVGGGDRREEPIGSTAEPGVGDAIAGVARAGVAVASGTARLGLKAAGGALGAIRGTIERR